MEWYVIPLFILGLLFLIKGGDWFVDGASGIAHRFHIPEILIGATVVSIGTTLPEVMVSATSAIQGIGGIAYGNAIGSIICNTSLIAAITIAIKPSGCERRTLIVPTAFFFGAAVLYSLTAYIGGRFTRSIGIILLLVFAVYMTITVLLMKRKDDTPEERAMLEAKAQGVETVVAAPSKKALLKDMGLIVVGAALIAIGADLLVDNATIIARALGIPEAVIGLTIVALGTSLPELVTAITSLVKGHSSLSLGNIIGANLFNLILVSGVAITISPFSVPNTELMPDGVTLVSLAIDIPVMLGVMLILTLPALIKQKLSRFQGISLLVIYVAYCVVRFALG